MKGDLILDGLRTCVVRCNARLFMDLLFWLQLGVFKLQVWFSKCTYLPFGVLASLGGGIALFNNILGSSWDIYLNCCFYSKIWISLGLLLVWRRNTNIRAWTGRAWVSFFLVGFWRIFLGLPLPGLLKLSWF